MVAVVSKLYYYLYFCCFFWNSHWPGLFPLLFLCIPYNLKQLVLFLFFMVISITNIARYFICLQCIYWSTLSNPNIIYLYFLPSPLFHQLLPPLLHPVIVYDMFSTLYPLNPNGMVSGDWAFGRSLGCEGADLMNGVSSLIRGGTRQGFSFSHLRIQLEGGRLQTMRKPFSRRGLLLPSWTWTS